MSRPLPDELRGDGSDADPRAADPRAAGPRAADPHAADPTATGEADADPSSRSGATITPYRDGPLVVRGDFRLVDQDGAEIDPGRRTVALCRCGKSGIKPFCDGTHKRSGFVAGSAPRRPRPASHLRAADPG